MCGIFFVSSAAVQVDHAEDRFQKIAHRGPDSSILCQLPGGAYVGCHRLEIIGLGRKGDQPLLADDNACVACNGQIYNYRELARAWKVDVDSTDVSVIFGMKEFREETQEDIQNKLKAVDGDFAFVLIKDRDVLVARDPVGVRPLFCVMDANGCIVAAASEAKALLDIPGSLQVFPPGHFWRNAAEGFVCYTDIYNTTKRFLPENYAVIEADIRTLLREAVRKRLDHSERPVALLCSGGLDSSLVLVLAHEILSERGQVDRLHTFSMQFSDSRDDGSTSTDAMYVKLLTGQLKVTHTAVSFTMEEAKDSIEAVIATTESYDPNTIRASVPMYLLAKYIANETDYKVVLSGETADEIFAGYNSFQNAKSGSKLHDETQRLVKNLHCFDLLRADRCFAAHGLDIRVPYADKHLLRYVFHIPGRMRMFQSRVEKALLRDAFRCFDVLEYGRVIDRPKERFSDGVSFNYVPFLLQHCISVEGIETSELAQKEFAERNVYGAIFDRLYPGLRHLIIEREMPKWCRSNPGSEHMLLPSHK